MGVKSHRVIDGVCEECGAQVALPGVHINWHIEIDKQIMRLQELTRVLKDGPRIRS